MALFFDQEWFEARLAEAGLNRDTVAAALGLSAEQVDEVWKDQRELTVEEVTVLAALLGQPVEDVVNHAGIATPQPGAARPLAPGAGGRRVAHQPPGEASGAEAGHIIDRLDALDARMAGLERAVAELSALLKSMREEEK
ncbi:hypothetical protein FHS78_001691 [Parvibaculum indicum]|uniref:hypothetical protein n=1 Tax=Parvibaculum indicum TaxID=562969 RepID=UPI00141DDD71|nr:hypothetical protein [Parvibaculum indicum]NIJ41404.1 hypothetical protein [Parvibaculum indicum]